MNWKTIQLDLSDGQITTLKAQNARLLEHLEKGLPLEFKVLEDLNAQLSKIVNSNSDFIEVLEKINNSGEYCAVQLMHNDNEILNLPWSAAIDKFSGKALGIIRQLFLAKSLPRHSEARYEANDEANGPKAPLPLKILIMISSPEDTDHKSRLSYEDEEFRIFSAFEPLLQSGQVEIDFTDDGSLEALERKLKKNKYHVLHFSGHGIFQDREGMLVLEDPLSLKTQLTRAEDFADTVNCNPDYKVPLVILSSCQTAQGGSETALRGVTNQLLNKGLASVIAMGMSIMDHYAKIFSAHFFRQLAERQNILSAFQSSIQHMYQDEYNELVKARQQPIPLQWMIPNFYTSKKSEHLVDWEAPREELELRSYRFISEQNRLLLTHDDKYLFIGRRKDKARILEPFFQKIPVLLKGQGGVGKTAMAEHLVQRLIASNPKTEPFVFNETIRSIQDILDNLQKFLREQGNFSKADEHDKAIDKFGFLVFEIAKTCQPVFVFDNLETFQESPGGKFLDKHQDLAEAIGFLDSIRKFHLILTCRYPVPDFQAKNFDLNQVSLNDFWMRCHYLDIFTLQTKLLEQARLSQAAPSDRDHQLQFIDIVKLLHQTFGGNYRALELFDKLFREKPEKINKALENMELLQASIKEQSLEIMETMRENLKFFLLMELLDKNGQALLSLLANFRIPVQKFAIILQKPEKHVLQDLKTKLHKLNSLTLIEISLDPENQKEYYYASPIVKDLIAMYEHSSLPFSHKQAGAYHFHIFSNMDPSLTELEQAFYHFYEAKEEEHIENIGNILSRAYYNSSMFHNAFFYAMQVYEMLGEKTGALIQNRLGMIFHLYGQYDEALSLFKNALSLYHNKGDKSGEGAALNNISQIYDARGDYETALKYLEQSLKIRQEIGDKSGEGTTLNNISQIYKARGDYETALKYLEQSLKICQEIGDKSQEGAMLNNISQIYSARGDYETALKYLEQSLKICQEIGDKSQEGAMLNNISQIYKARGDYETALEYLEQSLKICQEIGDKSQEGATLNNISQIYDARGDHETALKYLEQSLEISQKIGDKSGEAYTLFNLAMTYLNELNQPEKAKEYFAEVAEINAFLKDARLSEALHSLPDELRITNYELRSGLADCAGNFVKITWDF
jgi:tetratricopeptide (TPR) repeat protein